MVKQQNTIDMDRLLNIGRESGFPICSETLGVLNANSEMLASWIKWLPLKNRQAVLFPEKDYMVVCQNLRKRVVKVGSIIASDLTQCKVEFVIESHNVQDNNGNEFENVWQRETAVIVSEESPALKWHIMGFEQVFETRLWNNCIAEFESGLASSTISHGSFIETPTLYGGGNILRGNTSRTQINLAIAYKIRANVREADSMVLSIPFPAPIPGPVRIEADVQVESTGYHYPIRAYINDNDYTLKVNIGRWLTEEGLYDHTTNYINGFSCAGIIRINKEIIL